MAEYRTVRIGFWCDPYIEELDAKGKLLYLYLFTCPYANNLGVVEVTRRKIAYETALTPVEVDKYLELFEQHGKVVCDEDFNLIFLTNFIKHQCSTSPRILTGLQSLAPCVCSEKIAKAICIRYPQVYGVSKEDGDTVSIPYANHMHTLCIPSGEIGIWNLEFGKGKEEDAPDGPPPCPHVEIQAMYHEILPQLPKVVTWGKERQEFLRARWRETWERLKSKDQPHGTDDLLAWWRTFFERVRASPFLLGQEVWGKGSPFYADLEWLVRPRNYAKVVDGKYLPKKQGNAA